MNIYLLHKIIQYDNTFCKFYNKWYDQLDYINTTMRYIRKVQSKCKLISIFEFFMYSAGTLRT